MFSGFNLNGRYQQTFFNAFSECTAEIGFVLEVHITHTCEHANQLRAPQKTWNLANFFSKELSPKITL